MKARTSYVDHATGRTGTVDAVGTPFGVGRIRLKAGPQGASLGVWNPAEPERYEAEVGHEDPLHCSAAIDDDGAAALVAFIRLVRPDLGDSVGGVGWTPSRSHSYEPDVASDTIEWTRLPESSFEDPTWVTVRFVRDVEGQIVEGSFEACDGESCTVTMRLESDRTSTIAGSWVHFDREDEVEMTDADLVAFLAVVRTVRPDLWQRGTITGSECPAPWRTVTQPY